MPFPGRSQTSLYSAESSTVASERKASGWVTLLVVFGLASTIEAFTVSHVFRFLPLYLATVHVPPAEAPPWTGYLNATFFVFGLPLVPFWGVWSERYGRLPLIPRSAFVEMLVFADLFPARGPAPACPGGSGLGLAASALRLPLSTRIPLVVFGVFGLAYFEQQVANPFLPLIVLRMHGSAGDIGVVFGASALVGALLSSA